MKNRPFYQRLSFALIGLSEAWRRERSFRTQAVIGAVAVMVTAALKPGLVWAALVAISISFVLAFELMNSAIECMIDHLHPNIAPQIKLAKDVAAAAVLVACIGALSIGALLAIAWLGS